MVIYVIELKYSFSARLLQLHQVVSKGMVVSKGKVETLIGFDTHKDYEVKYSDRGQVID